MYLYACCARAGEPNVHTSGNLSRKLGGFIWRIYYNIVRDNKQSDIIPDAV